jgi:hypothetical protein
MDTDPTTPDLCGGDLLDLDLGELPNIDEVLAMLASGGVVLGPPPTASRTLYSYKISIRIPHDVLARVKAEAEACGIGYQTLINQILADRASRYGKT